MSNHENYTWRLQGLVLLRATLYGKNGVCTTPGRVENKEDNEIEFIMDLRGDMGLGFICSVRALTSLPLELRFGWGGERGLFGSESS